ncbi:hypothetical protein, partial [Leptospira borgpetersenii]|uniref:hypothetical protein n=1 Tax=Leptospira borgpetersenii TaxID=174 RepID=UPI0027DC2B12
LNGQARSSSVGFLVLWLMLASNPRFLSPEGALFCLNLLVTKKNRAQYTRIQINLSSDRLIYH